jgi:hypothetical protein
MRAVSPLATYRVSLVNENNGGLVLFGHLEHFPHQSSTLTNVLLNQFRTTYADERTFAMMSHCFCKQSLTSTWRTAKDYTRPWSNPNRFE